MNTVRINGQDYTSSLSDAEIAFMGNFSLPTTAQTLSGAIAEHENDISELNSKLGYTLVDSVTGTTEVILPANWKEIIVVVGYSGSYMNSVSIPYAFAPTTTLSMGFGIFGTSYAIGYVSKTKVSLNTVNWGGSTVTSSSTLSVYAR